MNSAPCFWKVDAECAAEREPGSSFFSSHKATRKYTLLFIKVAFVWLNSHRKICFRYFHCAMWFLVESMNTYMKD